MFGFIPTYNNKTMKKKIYLNYVYIVYQNNLNENKNKLNNKYKPLFFKFEFIKNY